LFAAFGELKSVVAQPAQQHHASREFVLLDCHRQRNKNTIGRKYACHDRKSAFEGANLLLQLKLLKFRIGIWNKPPSIYEYWKQASECKRYVKVIDSYREGLVQGLSLLIRDVTIIRTGNSIHNHMPSALHSTARLSTLQYGSGSSCKDDNS
jgi:hypothetical protein